MTKNEIMSYGFYVYLHRSALDGHIFYVGKGARKRAWSSYNRSTFWKNTVAKHGKVVEVVEAGLQEWAAFELEISLIALYGRSDLGDGPLCNHSDGGDGNSNPTAETRKKQSDHQSRRIADGSHQFLSSVGRALQRLTVVGDMNPSKRLEVRQAISKSKLGELNPMKGVRGSKHPKSRGVLCVSTGDQFGSALLAGEWIKQRLGMESSRQGSKIGAVCRGERARAYGHKWAWAAGKPFELDIENDSSTIKYFGF